MLLNDKQCVTFDIEVLKNCFLCTTYNMETNELKTFEVSERKNEISELINFFIHNKYYFVGYNNIHYDTPIINFCIKYFYDVKDHNIITTSIYNMSNVIVSDTEYDLWKEYKFADNFLQIDLMTMLYSKALRVSLKELQVTMNYKNVQEMKVDWNKDIELSKIDELISYNINDVMSTSELLSRCEKDLQLRLSIEKEYGIKCMSKDGVGIGTELLKQKYLQATGLTWNDIKDLRSPMDYIPLKDVILPQISYSTPVLQSLLEELKISVVSPGRKGLERHFILDGRLISIGVGGIHSKNNPEIIIPQNDELLLDCDAASLYPSLLIEYGFYPPHLGKEFVDIYK